MERLKKKKKKKSKRVSYFTDKQTAPNPNYKNLKITRKYLTRAYDTQININLGQFMGRAVVVYRQRSETQLTVSLMIAVSILLLSLILTFPSPMAELCPVTPENEVSSPWTVKVGET